MLHEKKVGNTGAALSALNIQQHSLPPRHIPFSTPLLLTNKFFYSLCICKCIRQAQSCNNKKKKLWLDPKSDRDSNRDNKQERERGTNRQSESENDAETFRAQENRAIYERDLWSARQLECNSRGQLVISSLLFLLLFVLYFICFCFTSIFFYCRYNYANYCNRAHKDASHK